MIASTIRTNGTDIILRPYVPGDAEATTQIYAHYVNNSVITFDLDAPNTEYIANKMANIQNAGHPLIVAQIRSDLVGYAYASTYRDRPAYRFTCENAIYLNPEYTGKGIGSQLLGALIKNSKDFGFNQMIAIITQGSEGSIALHKKFGFVTLGEFPELGFKFGQWHGVTHMQKKL